MKYNVILVLSTLSILSACKIEQDPESRGKNSFYFPNMTNSTERFLNTEEVGIAKRICSSLKKKRFHFETLANNTHSFRATYATKTCTQSTLSAEKSFVVTLDNSNPVDMEYRSTDIDFNFKDVLTDQSPRVKEFCEELEKDITKVSNTFRSNLVTYTFAIKSVKKGMFYDRLEILKRVPSTTTPNTLIVQSGDAYEFYTKPEQAEEKFMGVEIFKERYGTCENPQYFSTYKETFTKPLTSF